MKQETFVENSHGRHSDDFYRTPPEVTRALCDELKLRGIEPNTILDVGCGDGAIGRVCRASFPGATIRGIEIDKARYREALRIARADHQNIYTTVWHHDWHDQELNVGVVDLIVSNVWFRQALSALKLAVQRVLFGGHVAFLLISQWDQETVHDDERGKFLDSLRRADGSEGYGKLRWKGRIDFRGDGRTDRVSHEWLIIGPGFEGSFVRIPRSPLGGSEQLQLGAVR